MLRCMCAGAARVLGGPGGRNGVYVWVGGCGCVCVWERNENVRISRARGSHFKQSPGRDGEVRCTYPVVVRLSSMHDLLYAVGAIYQLY